MATVEEMLSDQILANAKLTTHVSSLERMVATLAAEIAFSASAPSSRLDEILEGEEEANISELSDAGMGSTTGRETYLERAGHLQNLANLAHAALDRLLTKRR